MTDFDLSKCPKNEQGQYLAMTRAGAGVRIICTDVAPDKAIIGLVWSHDGSVENVYRWDSAGRYLGNENSKYDLINIPPKKVTRTVYRNTWFYEGCTCPVSNYYETQESALVVAANTNRFRYLERGAPITWEEEEKA